MYRYDNRVVITLTGPERLSWLHSLVSQDLAELPDGAAAESLNLDAHGHVLDDFWVTEVAGVTYLDTEPGSTLAASRSAAAVVSGSSAVCSARLRSISLLISAISTVARSNRSKMRLILLASSANWWPPSTKTVVVSLWLSSLWTMLPPWPRPKS